MPKCSVIIPNFNHSQYLEQRINSILTQTFDDYEIIILDDASSDNSRTIIEKYRNQPRITEIIYNSENTKNPFLQWKKGIEKAKGKWIWIAESDDYANTDFLKTAFEAVNKFPDIGFFYSDSLYDTNSGHGYRYRNSAAFKNDFFKTQKWSEDYYISGKEEFNFCLKFICTIINTSSTVIRKEQLLKVTDNITNFRYYGDWYAFANIAFYSSIYYSSKPLNICRMHHHNFLAGTNSIEGKKEYFQILNCFVNFKFVTNKNTLIAFFTREFIGFGLFHDGIKHGYNIFRSYFSINKLLTIKVLIFLIWQKLTFKKRRIIY
ncbi:MAG: glycosyltransferase family 2 protein [Flavobacteriaceae bacterium]|nr:glycosyltransferase family 2 protein [Flavobacteriaceae bacterium]